MAVSLPSLKGFKYILVAGMQYRKWVRVLGRKLEGMTSLAPSDPGVSWPGARTAAD